MKFILACFASIVTAHVPPVTLPPFSNDVTWEKLAAMNNLTVDYAQGRRKLTVDFPEKEKLRIRIAAADATEAWHLFIVFSYRVASVYAESRLDVRDAISSIVETTDARILLFNGLQDIRINSEAAGQFIGFPKEYAIREQNGRMNNGSYGSEARFNQQDSTLDITIDRHTYSFASAHQEIRLFREAMYNALASHSGLHSGNRPFYQRQ